MLFDEIVTRSGWGRRRRLAAAAAAMALAVPVMTMAASADPVTDPPLHGGTGTGVKVVGHTDLAVAGLGRMGLNASVAVLGDYAYVGAGTNGGHAGMWGRTPRCLATDTVTPALVKVVSLANPANPQVVSTITVGNDDTLARSVSVLKVNRLSPANDAFTGTLLAVAKEACTGVRNSRGVAGTDYYDVTDPTKPKLLAAQARFFATTEVKLVQRPDGKVISVEAHQDNPRSGVFLWDVTDPLGLVTLEAEYHAPVANFVSLRGCRPFTAVQGVSVNAAGTKAYVAYGDYGLVTLDLTTGAATLPELSHFAYPAADEGQSNRFVPNSSETVALATDDDLDPASTTVTVTSGSASTVAEPGGIAGVFKGCSAQWGKPLFRSATPSITAEVVRVNNGFGCDPTAIPDLTGKIALVPRGGNFPPGVACSFDEKARQTQARGAIGLLISNTVLDHHGGGAGFLFSPDSVQTGNAGVNIPVAMITQEAGAALQSAINSDPNPVTATFAATADTWGALRVMDISTATPTQIGSSITLPSTTSLTPGDGFYQAVQPLWEGNQALVSWMSEGLRVFDLSTPATPRARAHYIPAAQTDPSGNFGQVPLVTGIAKAGSHYVMTDINGGLYVLNVVTAKSQCKDGGHVKYGFTNQGTCTTLFDT